MILPTKAEILAALQAAGLDAVERAADRAHYPTAEAAVLLSWLSDRGLRIEEFADWRETEDGQDEICTGVVYNAWMPPGKSSFYTT